MYSEIVAYKKTIGILVLIVGALGVLTFSFIAPNGFFSGLSNDLKEIEGEGEFMYTDLDGNPVSLVDYKGKPLIINSWATWMPFSAHELQLLDATKVKYGDDIVILAINRMENTATVRAYLDFIGKPEHIVFLSDPSDNFYKAVGGYAMPETVFYNREGILIEHTRGVLREEELTNQMNSLLEAK